MSVPDPHQLHDQLTTAAHSMVAPPEQLHEDLVKSIMEVVGKMIDARVPKLATVTGQDGGKVLVQMDDEDTPRQLGFSRKNGQRYNPGDRVVAMPTGSGDDHVILGTITSAQGQGEQAVGNPDLIDQSVNQDKLAKGSVNRNHIQNGEVLSQHLSDGAATNKKIGTQEVQGAAGPSGGTRNITQGSIGKSDLDPQTVQKSLDKADSALQSIPNDVALKSDLPDVSDYWKKNDAEGTKLDFSLKADSSGKITGSITIPKNL